MGKKILQLLIAVLPLSATFGCGSDAASNDHAPTGLVAGDSGTEDAKGDAATEEAGALCEWALDVVCGGGNCRTEWPADLSLFCEGPQNGLGGVPSVNESCGAYRVLLIQGVDMRPRSYYDAVTGKLVAVVTESANFHTTRCAGLPDFEEPVCAGTATRLDCTVDSGGGGNPDGGA
jgi:hypothetical protein